MTSDRLYELLKFLDTLDSSLSLQSTLEAIQSALTNLVSSPAQPQYQSALAEALAAFEAAVKGMRDSISPSQLAAIKAMGGEEFFDPLIADKVKNAVQMNAMTPSVAKDFVQELASRRKTFLSTIRSARKALEGLEITEAQLAPGSADVAFLIPRDIFENQLGAFAKELIFISRLIQHFSEALTGETEPVELEQLSSSIPTVTLLASVPVLSVLGTVINKFLDAWLKIERIRRLRTELSEIGIKRTAVEELTEEITTTVDEVVEESTVLVLAPYDGEHGRKSELDTAIRQDVRRLFGQIERGLTVEFRTAPKADDETADSQKLLENISNLGMQMKFPQVAREPMLLAGKEVIEGELHTAKHSKKTTSSKKTTKKEAQKEGNAEAKE